MNIIKTFYSRFKASIFRRSLNPKDEKDRLGIMFNSVILHLHPSAINEKTIKFNHTFGLGGMAIVLICVQFITGLLLRFYYEPFPGLAYESIITLKHNVLFGQLIRNLHYWSATFLIIISVLHLLRVFYTGAFQNQRRFNWVLGLLLLAAIILSNFSGYLLPWDQLSYWAVTVGTNMMDYIPIVGTFIKNILLGGEEIGGPTLLIFYNLHTGILPILIILLMAFHFWRVRKAGGVIIPDDGEEDKIVTTMPNLVAKEFVVALILISIIFLLAVFFNAPILEKANPSFSPNPAKAPWYFLGIQELMLHFHPLISVFIIPVIASSFLFLFPYINYKQTENGKWFYSIQGRKYSLFSGGIGFLFTVIYVLIDEYIFKNIKNLSFLSDSILFGFVQLILILSLFYFYIKYSMNKKKLGGIEILNSIFSFLLIAFLTLTVIGILFRGEGMKLIF